MSGKIINHEVVETRKVEQQKEKLIQDLQKQNSRMIVDLSLAREEIDTLALEVINLKGGTS